MKDAIFAPKNRFVWSLLAFQGGYVNVAGFLTVHLFVSHVTGLSGQAAIAIKNYNLKEALSFLMVPLFFLLGSFLSGFLVSVKRSRNQKPDYSSVMVLLALIYAAIALSGERSLLGNFGEPFHNFRDFVLLAALAFNCGAQNALFTHYSHSIVRTTHLTGLTTDLGIGLAKMLFLKDHNEGPSNLLRVELISSFLLGSIGSAVFLSQIGFLGFYFPAVISLFTAYRLRGRKSESN